VKLDVHNVGPVEAACYVLRIEWDSVEGHMEGALVLKYSLAGLLPGWTFWCWGLPYAILCHFAANAIHLLLQPMGYECSVIVPGDRPRLH
jgi:hypothetical protein